MNLPPLSDLPDWSMHRRVGLDIETKDPMLRTLGPGVRRGDGFIAGVSFAVDGESHYLPMRHEGGENYPDPGRVMDYLRQQARYFDGEIVGANLQYDLDWLTEDGVEFTRARFRDIQVSGPLLIEPQMRQQQDPETGDWFWVEAVQLMNLDAQARRAGLEGKDEAELRAWAEARGLDPKKDMWRAPAGVVAKYARVDASLPLEVLSLHEREIDAQGLREVYDMESDLLPVLLKMRRVGVAVDLGRLERIRAKAHAKEVGALRTVESLTGVRLSTDDINKSAAWAIALEADGVKVPRTKKSVSEKTGKEIGGNPSVQTPWLRKLGTPLALAIVDAKKWNKIRLTFCESIASHTIRGRVHCTFNQLRQEQDDGEQRGAAFGRLSSSNPNLQQQPARDPEIAWRDIYLPDEGGQWACIDFSSQEPRMITHYAEVMASSPQASFPPYMRWSDDVRAAARAAADACRTDPKWDNHSMMAGFIFGSEYSADAYRAGDKTAKGLREKSKIIFLGRCYGMGGGKLCRQLGLPTRWVVRDPRSRRWEVYDVDSEKGRALQSAGARPFEMAGPEGEAILARFDAGVPYVKHLTKLVQNKAERAGYITTLSGRRCRFPRHPKTGELMWSHKALNRLIQGSSADQTKRAMVIADRAGIRMQLQVHDEVDLTIWDMKEAKELEDIMVHAVELNVPTRCDVETGDSWGTIK